MVYILITRPFLLPYLDYYVLYIDYCKICSANVRSTLNNKHCTLLASSHQPVLFKQILERSLASGFQIDLNIYSVQNTKKIFY